jgi:hypothetical protein
MNQSNEIKKFSEFINESKENNTDMKDLIIEALDEAMLKVKK